MIIGKKLFGLILVAGLLVVVGGSYMLRFHTEPKQPQTTYIFNKNTLIRYQGKWFRACSVTFPTEESFNKFMDDYTGQDEPPCPVLVLPDTVSLPIVPDTGPDGTVLDMSRVLDDG